MSNGLIFRKVDLHIHTPKSKCFIDKTVSASDIVNIALERELDAIAITDHNTGAFIDQIKQAANMTPLTIFPGVEITVSEGIHVIALFDTEKGSTDILNLLGVLEIKPEEQGETTALCKHGIHKVVEKIIACGGLVILAHIDQPKGAFYEMSGIPLVRLINETPFHAVETLSGELPPDFTKERGFKRFPSSFQSSDNPDSLEATKHSKDGIGTKYSNFKFDKVINLEGLRQCFADPEVRIRKMGMLEEIPFPKIISIQASDGFLKFQNIRFHYGLNSIIGGKGVGKSLIIEFLRYALDQPSNNEEILKDFNGKLTKRLGPYNFVEVMCQLPSGSQYKIKRTLNGSYECMDLSIDQPYNGKVSELFPILAYSQTEVIKITEDEEAQLSLIDSFINPRPFLGQIESLNRQLVDNDMHLAEAVQANYDAESYQQDLDTVIAQISEIDRSFKNTSDDKLLSEYRILEGKKLELENFNLYLNRIGELVAEWQDQIVDVVPPSLKTELSTDDDLVWVHLQCQSVNNDVVSSLNVAKNAMNQRIIDVNTRITECNLFFEEKNAEYMAFLEKEKSKQELEVQRQSLIERRQYLLEKVNHLKAISGKLVSIQTERNKWLDDLSKAYFDYFNERRRMFDILTKRSDGKLKLELTHATNYQKYQGELRDLVRGSGARTVDIETISQKITSREFVDIVRNRDTNGLATQTGITQNSAQTIIEKLLSAETIQPLLNLEHSFYPEDVPSIQFRKEGGEYAPLTELSVGQKCTALLIIALSEGTRPVIIDQPEDALDITTVWEDISKKLRQCKENRQFILTTHNPSVAVAADSDMFIVVKSNAQQANVKCLGAIEHPDVKSAVIQHLEGGEDPYQLRRNKYNL